MSIKFKVGAAQPDGDHWVMSIFASTGNFNNEDTCGVSFCYNDVQNIVNMLSPALTELMKKIEELKNVD